MDRLFAAVSRIQGDRSQRQGAGLFVVASFMYSGMPASMDFFHTDTGKVPPNRKFPENSLGIDFS